MSDWCPAASLDALRLRAELLRRVRAFFDGQGFWEVETPLLASEVAVERQLDPLSTTLFFDPREPTVGPRYVLQTSPEAHMKRLVAAGADAIYQVTRSFRGGEAGDRHNPEFTIVEWYRVGDTMADGMDRLAELARVLLGVERVERLSYREAFLRHVDVDPHRATADELAACAIARAVPIPASQVLSDRDGWLNLLLADRVEPQLGRDGGTILYDYPASQAAFAEIGPPEESHPDSHPPVAKRFELYVRGVELANGYWELTDADELARRMHAANDGRVADGKRPLPIAERMIAAQRHGLPCCVGVALGFDRVVMLAAGVTRIQDVLAFPIDRA